MGDFFEGVDPWHPSSALDVGDSGKRLAGLGRQLAEREASVLTGLSEALLELACTLRGVGLECRTAGHCASVASKMLLFSGSSLALILKTGATSATSTGGPSS